MHRLLIALACVVLSSAPLAQKAPDPHAPKHGGIVMEVKGADLELVAKSDLIQVYVSDHGKPMKVTSATGKVTVYNGTDKVEAPLTLTGDRLEAKGNFKIASGTRVVVDTAINGASPVAARFTVK